MSNQDPKHPSDRLGWVKRTGLYRFIVRYKQPMVLGTVALVILVPTLFFGPDNLSEQVRYSRHIIRLEREIKTRRQQFIHDSLLLESQYKRTSKDLEDFARNKFGFVEPDELVFIVSDSTAHPQ